MSMNLKSDWIRVDFIKGSRRFSNLFWALVLLLGSLGFFFVGLSSYLGINVIPFLSAQHIIFVPQGIVMCFYGIAGFFVSLYFWFTICWNIGSGYNIFDKKKGVFVLFRWGFPGKNRRILFKFFIKDIKAIRMDVQEGFFPHRILYLKLNSQKEVPLSRIGESLTLREMEEKAAKLARFLKVSIEGF